jgi:hypothetical protein
MSVGCGIEVRATLDSSHPSHAGKQSDWHNGYFSARRPETSLIEFRFPPTKEPFYNRQF